MENRKQKTLTNVEIVNQDRIVDRFPELFYKEFNLYRVLFKINY